MHHPAIYPLVGGDPYDPNNTEVTTSCDLHLIPQHSLVIMQIRAPLIKVECLRSCYPVALVSLYLGYYR